jgi:exonuclease SbcD
MSVESRFREGFVVRHGGRPLIRFLHAADLHLDSPLRDLEKYEGAPVERIRGASRRALENLVQLAIEERVDFVILAGDIYDCDWHDAGTGLFFVGQMAKLSAAGIPVFAVAGNHDAANKMTRKLPYPDNVRVFPPGTSSTITLDHLGVALHGQSYADQAETNNLAIGYPAAVRGMLNIGVLHTALTGRAGHESYAPCLLDDLETREYDYWALGHVHERESVREASFPRVEFPGNTQGRHIREAGAKGCILATANGRGIERVEFRPLDVVRWQRIAIDCAGAADVDDVLQRVNEGFEKSLAVADGRLLAARVELYGSCSCHDALLARQNDVRDNIRAFALQQAEGELWIEKVQVQTRRPRDDAALNEISGDALSAFAAVAEDLSARPEQLKALLEMHEIKALAAKLPSELKEGDDAVLLGDPAWAKALLDLARSLLVDEATRSEAARSEAARPEAARPEAAR